jgi:hypothetical protein
MGSSFCRTRWQQRRRHILEKREAADSRSPLVGQVEDADGHLNQLHDLCRTEAPRSGDNLEGPDVGPHSDGLNKAVSAQALGQLGQFKRLKRPAWVCG